MGRMGCGLRGWKLRRIGKCSTLNVEKRVSAVGLSRKTDIRKGIAQERMENAASRRARHSYHLYEFSCSLPRSPLEK